ncbi:hypothetical protein [Dyadobacter frigoris]|uniref:Uncharacterized protein n=1 Tax=Dyadobacter frigoris TaxID=2576211 RepID=A0A4U6DHD3_9BACT|nr:hypothetical protein [Dyadobacter frigoris]TKT94114.1 hypothetical protein FDK13_02570 [Dyadobacter frigoris]GLU50675.1 hypothetical protein Dfri01_01360 [Dyadobacter frigoris]
MRAKLFSSKTSLFKTHTSHSPEEILASGGATAFGRKTGKSNETLISALKNAEPAEPFTSEEWEKLMAQLDATK